MAHYAIGDLQGCYTELTQLLEKIEFNHGTDTLWLVGDIVNRGTQSLACLQFCRQHESSVQIVLGNHDLHLLAIWHGFGKLKKGDTVQDILNHTDAKKMLNWLQNQALLRQNDECVLVHAGLFPEWSVAEAAEYSHELEQVLRGKHAKHFFENMYGNTAKWSPQLKDWDRLRFIANAFTRMRVLLPENVLDFDFKSVYADIVPPNYAWFDAPHRQNTSHTVVFGHWSALGLVQKNGVIGLDTGALWGGQLTAVNLANHTIHQVQSQSHKPIKK
ncbi:symmetrical bis(5'-nucleosyl)-tetraphosphatase [Alysiella filiformis]|uniref:bis(5'-nucleosyl)-tetraphosphatase (symmetrical) n=1 Tax=Alysiella filiformis DSM 16848 TaxID=1120981 RepID=A0A286E8S2_9NEIS|nr:symmetrical bis(5'-nucleosyl)-tetraphosphatase [Alysiella filiformis]QMT32110.1 symmetrical bis(5'-nucleosyl)-tetraphosphatase [Alysiella filiformis]UBQ56979.1 symmetrical bis(5'-nucleosyl)-tetraphosphatase [Alysiella filiformis DSM 16848]SOD67279.1 Bis(5'nucleosyl)-tetraphosphatase, ApaH [Alysiella filiformis DSM 16848]